MRFIYFDIRDQQWHVARGLMPVGMWPHCTDGGVVTPDVGDVVVNGLSSVCWESYLPSGLTFDRHKGEATGEQHSRFVLEMA